MTSLKQKKSDKLVSKQMMTSFNKENPTNFKQQMAPTLEAVLTSHLYTPKNKVSH